MKKYSTKSDISRSDVPEKVFRFCEFDEQEDYKMDILTKHHFYFSSIKDWDSDYREGTLPFDFDAINKDDIKKFTDLVVRREFPYKTASQKAVMRDKLIAEKLKFYNKGNRIQVEKMWIDIVEKYYGFLSFSHRIDNVAIWEYRGNLFKGYCIEFDCFNLVQTLEFLPVMGYVRYYPKSEIPKVKPLTRNAEEAIRKSLVEFYSVPEDYEYEQEYRMVISAGQEKIGGRELKKKDRLCKFNPSSISSIIFGEDMPQEERDIIINVVKSFEHEVSIKEAKFDQDLKAVIVELLF